MQMHAFIHREALGTAPSAVAAVGFTAAAAQARGRSRGRASPSVVVGPWAALSSLYDIPFPSLELTLSLNPVGFCHEEHSCQRTPALGPLLARLQAHDAIFRVLPLRWGPFGCEAAFP